MEGHAWQIVTLCVCQIQRTGEVWVVIVDVHHSVQKVNRAATEGPTGSGVVRLVLVVGRKSGQAGEPKSTETV